MADFQTDDGKPVTRYGMGSTLRYLNHYKCECGNAWDDEWSCACDDECSECRTDISPDESDYIGPYWVITDSRIYGPFSKDGAEQKAITVFGDVIEDEWDRVNN